MNRKSGLGRGLSSLIPAEYSEEATGDEGTSVFEVPVAAIRPNPRQPRAHFDEESLAGLTASIAELGVLQPVLVHPTGDGGYELIAGERRWRASKRAGLQTIPVVVRDADTDASLLEQALVENLHRADLNAMEEAAAYQQLIEDFGLTQEAVAKRVGKSRAAISNTLRLFQLPPAIQALVAEDQLTAGHARALLGTPDRPAPRPVDPAFLELEHLLSDHLDTRVSISGGAGSKGRLVVEFADIADLERIYHRMAGD